MGIERDRMSDVSAPGAYGPLTTAKQWFRKACRLKAKLFVSEAVRKIYASAFERLIHETFCWKHKLPLQLQKLQLKTPGTYVATGQEVICCSQSNPE